MKIFILEDDPARIAAFEVALGCFTSDSNHEVTIRTFLAGPGGAFEAYLKGTPYDLLLLDHDLGGCQMVDSNEEETGFAFVKWLAAQPRQEESPIILVHSWNPDGARKMIEVLRKDGLGSRIRREEFGKGLLQWLQGLED